MHAYAIYIYIVRRVYFWNRHSHPILVTTARDPWQSQSQSERDRERERERERERHLLYGELRVVLRIAGLAV